MVPIDKNLLINHLLNKNEKNGLIIIIMKVFKN